LDEFRVLPSNYEKMVPEHLARLADGLERGRKCCKSREEWKRHSAVLRRSLLRSLGPVPSERTPLNPKITGKVRREGYSVEKLIYESRPNFHVTANLYLPEGAETPAPGVFCPHGHWPYAKHEPEVQSRCIGLALRGYVVLLTDQVGYGERKAQGHDQGMWLPAVGQSLQGILLWDNMRGLDYLMGRDEVDKERIGVTACSGGGNQTMYLSALDPRVKVSVPVCSVEVFEDQIVSERCHCECIPDMVKYANIPDVCSLIAPRPLLMINGVKDAGFTILRARKAYDRILRTYDLLGAKERLRRAEIYANHGYDREMREAMYSWFDFWLMGKGDEPVHEPPLKTEPRDSEILKCCGSEGLPRSTETLQTLYSSFASAIYRPSAFANEREWIKKRRQLRRDIVEVIFGGFPKRCTLRPENHGTIEKDGCRIEKVLFRADDDIQIPALFMVGQETSAPAPAVVFLTSEGKGEVFRRTDVAQVMKRGFTILALDYRGIGETQTDDDVAARNSLVIGKSIFGMRVWDVLRAVDYLEMRKDVDHTRIRCWGERYAALLALFAAALDDRIKRTVAHEMMASYIAERGFDQPASAFLPNLLKYADIPDIASMIAPRKLILTSLVDTLNRPVPEPKAEDLMKRTREIYTLLGSQGDLEIRGWTDKGIVESVAS
jgi:cephalosporin-C deacetylase-like acetyl esterase